MIRMLRFLMAGTVLVPVLECPKISEFTPVTFFSNCSIDYFFFSTYSVCLKGTEIILLISLNF